MEYREYRRRIAPFDIVTWIEAKYHHQRALDKFTPVEFEELHRLLKVADHLNRNWKLNL